MVPVASVRLFVCSYSTGRAYVHDRIKFKKEKVRGGRRRNMIKWLVFKNEIKKVNYEIEK